MRRLVDPNSLLPSNDKGANHEYPKQRPWQARRKSHHCDVMYDKRYRPNKGEYREARNGCLISEP